MPPRIMRGAALGGLLLVTLATAGTAAGEWRRNNREACARLDERLGSIESQRRLGYTPERGRKLQQEREKLEAKRRRDCR